MNILASVAFALTILSSFQCFSQNRKELSPGYYIVVSAYAESRESIAKNYTNVLKRKGISADYGFNSSRKLYFVYIKYFDNLRAALQNMQKTRQKGQFKDAWVRVVPGIIGSKASSDNETSTAEKENDKDQNQNDTAKTIDEIKQPILTDTILNDSTYQDEIVVSDNPEIKQYDPMTLGNTEVFLSLFNARNNRIVDGEVEVIDSERAKQITKVKGNEYLLLPDPKSKSGQLTLLCNIFGYRKIQQEINYPLPLADTVKPYIDLMGTTVVINFDLVRYHRGDITTLYNVYFYNDAAIMLPESRYELNNLLEMMKENVNYKIKLHGHSNGNYHGRIILMGDDQNFFSLDGSKQGVGSAKDLARQRAEVIKNWLTAQGIAAERMEVKSWGGRRPLFDRRSVNAKKNVRVDVEILAE